MMCAYLPLPLSPLNQSFDFQGELVPLGEVMAEFPLDPQLAKVLLNVLSFAFLHADHPSLGFSHSRLRYSIHRC